jgi:phage-related protein
VKPVRFLGDSLKRLRAFPEFVRRRAGYQLETIQMGEQPDDFKPMPAIGAAYRVIFTARRAEAVYVLHAFEKKAQATPKRDIDLARKRFVELSSQGADDAARDRTR